MNLFSVVISYSIARFNLFKSWVALRYCFTVITSELFFARRKANNDSEKYFFHVGNFKQI